MLPRLELRYPTQAFDGKLVFHGTRRRAELLTYGKGHTLSDCFLALPDEGIIFTGDLGFFQTQPYMADCDPQLWLAHLDALVALAFHTYLPGHGPVGTKEDIALQRQYILTIEAMLNQVIEQGGSVDEALRLQLPEPFGRWVEIGRSRFEANVRSGYERLLAGGHR